MIVEWSYASWRDLQQMHWRLASRVASAIHRFAETGTCGDGLIETWTGGRARLVFPTHVILFRVDTSRQVVFVGRVFRRER